MHPTILLPVQGKPGSLTIVWQSVYEKENYELKPVKFSLKTELVSHPAYAVGLVNTYT